MDKKRKLLILAKNKYGEFDIKGKTLKYNNQCNVIQSNTTGSGTTTSVVDGVFLIQCTSGNRGAIRNINIISGHKYFVTFKAKPNYNGNVRAILFNSAYATNFESTFNLTKDTYNRCSFVGNASFSDNNSNISFYVDFGETFDSSKNIEIISLMIIDLTTLSLDAVATIDDFYNTDIGKAIQNGFYFPYSQNCVIYNAETPFNFVYKTFAPTTDFELRSISNAQDIYHNTTGEITRKIGVVDLGTLAWNYNNGLFWTRISDRKSGNMNINIAKYRVVNTYSNMPNNTITGGYLYYADNIIINDTNYNNANDFKIAMDGVLLYYELDSDATASAESVSLKKSTNKCYDKNGLELEII